MGRERCGIDALEAWKGNGKAREADLSDLPMFSAPSPPPPPLLKALRTVRTGARILIVSMILTSSRKDT